MTTSGTVIFNPQLTDIVEDAFERVGTELRSGYDFRTARRSLNMLLIEWANRGINLWTVEQGAIVLVPNIGTYNVPLDTVDLIEHVIRTNDGSASLQSDLTISRISVSTYASIPSKLNTGRPIQLYFNRQSGATDPVTGVTYPTVTLWPIPDGSTTYTLIYWRLRRMQDAGDGITTQDIPFRFIPALTAGLAYYLAQKIPESQPKLQFLQAEYERCWELASTEDRETASSRFVPRIGYV